MSTLFQTQLRFSRMNHISRLLNASAIVICILVTRRVRLLYLSASALLNPGAKSRRLLAAAFLEQGYFEESRRFAQEALQQAPGYRAAKEILAEAERRLSQSDCDNNRNEPD